MDADMKNRRVRTNDFSSSSQFQHFNFFFFFFATPTSHRGSQGQGLNQHRSSDNTGSSDNHQATRELQCFNFFYNA